MQNEKEIQRRFITHLYPTDSRKMIFQQKRLLQLVKDKVPMYKGRFLNNNRFKIISKYLP